MKNNSSSDLKTNLKDTKPRKINPKIVKTIGLIAFALFFYFSGYLIGHRNIVLDQNYKPVLINKELFKPRTVNFSLFWEAWNKITEEYVGEPDTQKMVYGAISGMFKALGDPYSSFMEPNETKSFLEDLSGEISGIGAEIDQKDDKIMIVAPLEGSPAEKAGLKPQDQVVEIDNQTTEKMTLDEAISKIRGKAGTTVTLKIIHSGSTDQQEYKIVREKIQIKSVNWEMKGSIAYISINQFGDDTTDLMQKAAKEINDKNPKAIVLDLRSNPGGYLESAVDATSLFIPKGVVVKEKYKDGHVEESKTTLDPILLKYKIFVLTNGGSASAAEIMAGALQDTGRGVLVGEKTFGKGSVQNLENLTGDSTLRITIAKWLTPKDRAIDRVGIEPNIKVELTNADSSAGKDPQLDKALELANK